MSTPPCAPATTLTSLHLSTPGRENLADKSFWSLRKTLIAKPAARSKTGNERSVRLTLNSTRGGSMETEAKELMVMPTSSWPSQAVAMAMPVANSPSESLKSLDEKFVVIDLLLECQG